MPVARFHRSGLAAVIGDFLPIAALLSVAVYGPCAEAQLPKMLKWKFEATVIELIDPGGLFPNVLLGDPARGTLSYNFHDEPFYYEGDYGAYYSQIFNGPVVTLVIENPRGGEDVTFVEDLSNFLAWADIFVVNDHPVEISDSLFILQSVFGPAGFAGDDPVLEVDFVGPPDVLPDLMLPSELDIEDWPIATIAFYDLAEQDPFGTTIGAEIYSLTPLPTPALRPLIVSDFNFDSLVAFDQDSGDFLGDFASGNALGGPRGMTLDASGRLYVAGRNSSNVVRYDAVTGAFIDEFVAAGSGGLGTAGDVIIGPDGHLLVSSANTSKILRYDGETGVFLNEFAASPGAQPLYMIEGPDGDLYVGEFAKDRVTRYDFSTGALLGVFASGGGLDQPWGMAFGPDGDFYIASGATNEVLRYDGLTGAFRGAFVAAGSGGLVSPRGLEFGPDGNLYVTSLGAGSVLRFNGASGQFIDEFIAGYFDNPTDLLFLPGPAADADFDGDGDVDDHDLAIWRDSYGGSNVFHFNGDADADVDADGADFLAWQRQFGESLAGPDSRSVPEPRCALILAAAVTRLRWRRRASKC